MLISVRLTGEPRTMSSAIQSAGLGFTGAIVDSFDDDHL